MPRNQFGFGWEPPKRGKKPLLGGEIGGWDMGLGPQKKKRVQLTPGQRLYIWEHPKKYGRKCSICDEKITKQSDLQLDHTHPYSKGGTKLNLAHGHCNRMKGSGSLGKIQKTLGIKTKKRKVTRRKPKTKGKRWINPLTGRKEKVRPLFRI